MKNDKDLVFIALVLISMLYICHKSIKSSHENNELIQTHTQPQEQTEIVLAPNLTDKVVIETIAWESSGESFEGQIAVASVIKQRMIERHKTAEEIVLQPHQFSCWKDGKTTQKRKLTKKELDNARKVWELAKPDGYNHYYNYKLCSPSWAKSAKYQKKIGQHIFLKL